jgi:uncharacterized protein
MSERKPDAGGAENAPKSAAAPKCVMCGKPQDAKFKPFCCKRCADIDLGRWLKGSYSIPAVDPVQVEENGEDEGT